MKWIHFQTILNLILGVLLFGFSAQAEKLDIPLTTLCRVSTPEQPDHSVIEFPNRIVAGSLDKNFSVHPKDIGKFLTNPIGYRVVNVGSKNYRIYTYPHKINFTQDVRGLFVITRMDRGGEKTLFHELFEIESYTSVPIQFNDSRSKVRFTCLVRDNSVASKKKKTKRKPARSRKKRK